MMRKSPVLIAVLASLPLFAACASRAPEDAMSTPEPITNGPLSSLAIVGITSNGTAHFPPMPGLCSGTALAPDWVLTLENCGRGDGALACTPQQCVSIDRWLTHDDLWGSLTLVHLASPLPFTSYPQLTISPLPNHVPVTCAGVGFSETSPPRQAKFDTSSRPPDRFTLSSSQAGVDWGDFGGGCFWGSTLSGVMSYSGSAVDVSSSVLWIAQTVGMHTVCGATTCGSFQLGGETLSCGSCASDQVCKLGSCV
jgi:hypothetical protein